MISPLVYIINPNNYNDLDDKYYEYGGSTYYTSIDNGYMHFRISDYANPEKDILPLLKLSRLDNESVRIFTIGDMVEKNINEFRVQMSITVLMVSLTLVILLILFTTIFYKYLEDNRREIGIKYFMGFSKIKIYKKLLRGFIINSVCIGTLILLITDNFKEYLSLEFNIYLYEKNIFASYMLFLLIEMFYLNIMVKYTKINYIDIK